MRRALALLLVGLLAAFAGIGRNGVAGAAAVVVIGLLLVFGLPALVRSVMRSRSSRICWLVSLAVSAVIIAPQLALGHYKRAAAAAFGGVIEWLFLAAVLRLVIFLADYFRRRSSKRRRPASRATSGARSAAERTP